MLFRAFGESLPWLDLTGQWLQAPQKMLTLLWKSMEALGLLTGVPRSREGLGSGMGGVVGWVWVGTQRVTGTGKGHRRGGGSRQVLRDAC